MMSEITLYIVFVVLLLGASALLLRRPGGSRTAGDTGAEERAEFFPVHSRYFPQARRVLSLEDTRYMAGRASPQLYRRWRKSLRHAALLYLEGLREDFRRLNRLARLLALHSPKVQPKEELELARLNLKFQVLYGIVWCRLWLGRPTDERLGEMAALIGRLGSRLENASVGLRPASGALTP